MCTAPNEHNTKPTVVITRTPSHSKELIQELVDLGFNVISRPTIEITSPDDKGAALTNAIQSLSNYEWVILTSSNGVTEFVKAVNKIGTQEFPKIAKIIEYNASSKVIGRPVNINSVTDLLGYRKDGPKSP